MGYITNLHASTTAGCCNECPQWPDTLTVTISGVEICRCPDADLIEEFTGSVDGAYTLTRLDNANVWTATIPGVITLITHHQDWTTFPPKCGDGSIASTTPIDIFVEVMYVVDADCLFLLSVSNTSYGFSFFLSWTGSINDGTCTNAQTSCNSADIGINGSGTVSPAS
jgi:hypothetical protein